MQDHTEPDAPPRNLFFTVFPSIMLPMFLAVVDQTIVATALPAIAATLGSVERVSWVVVSYLIAATIAAPVYGQLRDVYGGKRVMFAALGVFLAGSVLCAVSTSVEMLALARVLQGLGGGGLMTLSQALIGETVPPRERARSRGGTASPIRACDSVINPPPPSPWSTRASASISTLVEAAHMSVPARKTASAASMTRLPP